MDRQPRTTPRGRKRLLFYLPPSEDAVPCAMPPLRHASPEYNCRRTLAKCRLFGGAADYQAGREAHRPMVGQAPLPHILPRCKLHMIFFLRPSVRAPLTTTSCSGGTVTVSGALFGIASSVSSYPCTLLCSQA